MNGKRVNRSQLAEIYGVAVTTVDAWTRRGCPAMQRPTSRGKGWQFDTAAVMEWLRQQAVANVLGDVAKIDREAAEKRRIVALASLAEHELAEKRGQLINVDLAIEVLRNDYGAVRARILGMPAKLAPEVALTSDPAEARAILEAEVHEILGELSNPDFGNGSVDRATFSEAGENLEGGDPEAASETFCSGVGGREPDAVAGSKRGGRQVADEPGGVPERDHADTLRSDD